MKAINEQQMKTALIQTLENDKAPNEHNADPNLKKWQSNKWTRRWSKPKKMTKKQMNMALIQT